MRVFVVGASITRKCFKCEKWISDDAIVPINEHLAPRAQARMRYYAYCYFLRGVAVIDNFFNTFGLTGGVLIILGVGILLFLLIAVVLERRTKILFPEREKEDDGDDFLSFDDDDKKDA